MSKEFHIFTHQDSQFEQAFVFEVEREEDSVEFRDLLMVTTTQHGELKTRIKFEDMIQSIIHHEGGNIDDSGVNVVMDMFKDLIPAEKKVEIMQELNDREIYNMDPAILIKAVEDAILLEEHERVKHETKIRGTE